MELEKHLSIQQDWYLEECFKELELFKKTGVLKEGRIKLLNEEYFNDNSLTLHTIGQYIYRELAIRYLKKS